MGSWIPTTESERKEMLAVIGAASIDELFSSIPEPYRMRGWEIPAGLSEMSVRNLMAGLAGRNTADAISFLGGGYYDHYIPAGVDALSGRSEFYTAYTPYQPETSQGTLQSIYEYQSLICRLTNMEFANASLYDGGTALFEAATMAVRIAKRNRVVIHPSVNPTYVQMLKTHAANLEFDFVTGDDPSGAACVLVQNPAFDGTVRDFTALGDRCHAAKALLVVSFYPVSLGMIKSPGEMGADIAVGEGQCLGMNLGFGGPYLGIMATRAEHVRKMPGRIAGQTEDHDGRRGFVLTLQAREQHIRRTKAMSNICSNQALCALRAAIYLCLLGKEGLRDLAVACHSKAEYLKAKLDFAQILNEGPTFNEFAVRLPMDAHLVTSKLLDRGFLAGLPLHDVGAGETNDLLIAVTEQRTRAELDAFAGALKDAACN
ncbi:MAG: aminomethyl-transferring glycine dehydrogenase subunit GcvPA [Candidatus Hydrogenedentes bacterium]|nr:aminomethyl-transferring glycine dehydrogenase subunit GcvPA [Candidatus Hydrogenedentota bacterium]